MTVDYATTDGTASAGLDYTAASDTLTFEPGNTEKTVTVLTNGDTDIESDETFKVDLSSATNATIADTQGLGTIQNDDAAFRFSSATYSASEGAGTATITVQRVGYTGGAGSVNYATSDGTASSGDYTAASGTLSFAAGETQKTFTITINDDSLYEADETVNLALSSATGGATLGSPAAAALTIVDNDESPSFSVADVSKLEGTSKGSKLIPTELTFTVRLSQARSQTTTVSYATVDSAAPPSARASATTKNSDLVKADYLAVQGTLTFQPGQTQKTVTVYVNPDTKKELDETFLLRLSASSGASILDGEATGTIRNDD